MLNINNINDFEIFGSNIVLDVYIFVIKYLIIRLVDRVSVFLVCLLLLFINVIIIKIVILVIIIM